MLVGPASLPTVHNVSQTSQFKVMPTRRPEVIHSVIVYLPSTQRTLKWSPTLPYEPPVPLLANLTFATSQDVDRLNLAEETVHKLPLGTPLTSEQWINCFDSVGRLRNFDFVRDTVYHGVSLSDTLMES